jgi:hypothetical protein
VVKHVDAAELRVVVVAVLAVAADAVLVAQHLLKLGAHLVTALRLHNSVWKFGTGNSKYRWHARVYPEQGNTLILPLLSLEL